MLAFFNFVKLQCKHVNMFEWMHWETGNKENRNRRNVPDHIYLELIFQKKNIEVVVTKDSDFQSILKLR